MRAKVIEYMDPNYTYLKPKTNAEIADSLLKEGLRSILNKLYNYHHQKENWENKNALKNQLNLISDDQWKKLFLSSEVQNRSNVDVFVNEIVIPKKLYKTFKVLLEQNAMGISSDHIMNIVVQSNNFRFIKMLLDDPRSKPHRSMAMEYAIDNKNSKVVKLLLDDPRVESDGNEVRRAAMDGSLEIAKMLLNAGYTITDKQLVDLAEEHKFKMLSELLKIEAVTISEKTLKMLNWLLEKWQTKKRYITGESYVPKMKAKMVREGFTYLQPKSPNDMKKQIIGMDIDSKIKTIQRMGVEYPQLFQGLVEDPNLDDETNQLLLLMKIKNAMKENKLDDVQTLITELGDKYGRDTILEKAKDTLFTTKEAEQLRISLYRHTRNEEEVERDELYNLYVFIGYSEDVERVVNGEALYKKELGMEKLVKIDKYNVNDLNAINMMKARARIQYAGDVRGNVYAVYIPIDWLDGESYRKEELEPMVMQWIEEHKNKL